MLEELHAHPGEYISGQQLAGRLGLSRTAIWKEIEILRGLGYDIEASSRRGYRLRGVPDQLLPAEVLRALGRLGSAPLPWDIIYHRRLGSTNQAAKELALQGAPEGTVVLAEEQTAGRGRLGRAWSSPPGVGIWVSLVLRPKLPPFACAPLTLVAAVAVAEAVEQATGLQPGIKWPNDLLLRGKKFGGILTELAAEMEQVNHLVVGIGLNANQTQAELGPDLELTATSLRLQQGQRVNRPALLAQLLQTFGAAYQLFLREGFAPFRPRWLRQSVTIGSRVVAAGPGATTEGTAVDLDPEGGLVIQAGDGARHVVRSGEVTLRLPRA